MENLVQLVNVISPFEERSAAKQLSKDTANRPDVDYAVQLDRLHL